MIDPHTLELIHQELDGANTAEESALLRDRLATDAGAREVFEEYRRLSSTLDRTPQETPPAGLRQSILEAVERGHSGGLMRRKPAWGFLRYGYALAAGLLLGAFLAPALLDWHPGGSSSDLLDLAGTMARRGDRSTLDWQEVRNLGSATMSGVVRLHKSGSLTMMEWETGGEGPSELTFEFDPERLELRAFEQPERERSHGHVTPGRVTWTCQGGSRYRFLLAHRGGAPAEVRIRAGRGAEAECHDSIMLLPER